MDRQATKVVLDTYQQIKDSFGVAQCIDYSRNTGGQGAQYSPDMKFNAMNAVEFKVDVERAVQASVSKELAAEILCNPQIWLDNPIRTLEMLDADAAIGRTFKARGIFPPRAYFAHIKR
jgi:hypothetical protein